MLEKIASFLGGTVGIILGIVFMFGTILPLNVIGLPLWADILILVGIQLTLLVGKLISAGLWIWGLIIILGNPITAFSIVYFVVFGIYCLYLLIAICSSVFNN
ncbi:MAG: hypothetical protein E7583_11400 [Ruminococcaceae bacterium]|nr:hypothetical protein [Oscillospiraceae bacterium]